MANNSLILYCKECLGFRYLAKYYPVGWFSVGEVPFCNYMNEFFEVHQECLENSKVNLAYEADIFDVTTESTWDGYLDGRCHQLYKEKPVWWDNDTHKHKPEGT